MHRNRFAACLALLLASGISAAQPWHSNEDCEVLARAIEQQVFRAATEARLERSAPPVARLAIGATDPPVCRRAVEVTTRAFGDALAAFSLSIEWERPEPGDYCRRGDLDQCYPGVTPLPRVPATRVAFVYEAWSGVRTAVQGLMPSGSRAGVAVFSASSLESALGRELRRSVNAPLHARAAR